jgi:hypothetical protein
VKYADSVCKENAAAPDIRRAGAARPPDSPSAPRYSSGVDRQSPGKLRLGVDGRKAQATFSISGKHIERLTVEIRVLDLISVYGVFIFKYKYSFLK